MKHKRFRLGLLKIKKIKNCATIPFNEKKMNEKSMSLIDIIKEKCLNNECIIKVTDRPPIQTNLKNPHFFIKKYQCPNVCRSRNMIFNEISISIKTDFSNILFRNRQKQLPYIQHLLT